MYAGAVMTQKHVTQVCRESLAQADDAGVHGSTPLVRSLPGLEDPSSKS